MTRKDRAIVIEVIAIVSSGMLGAFAVPTLVSAHDSVALFAGLILLVGWLSWTAYFLYRIFGSKLHV